MRKIHRLFKSQGRWEDGDSTHKSEPNHDLGPDVLYDGTTDPTGGVDIVFVHGLRGSSRTTWSKGDVCWPRDLLKDDIPESRVIAWGYDSSVAKVSTYASVESIYGHAGTLLVDLSFLRRGIVRIFPEWIILWHDLLTDCS